MLIFVCLLGNSLTIFILSRKRNRVTSTAVLLTIPAISDIVIVLTGILDSWLRFVWNVDIRISNEIIWASAWDFQQCGMCDQQSLRSACAYAQPDQSLCLSLEYSMIVKLLTEHHFEFLSLKGCGRGSSESTYVKMPHCWKSHALAHL